MNWRVPYCEDSGLIARFQELQQQKEALNNLIYEAIAYAEEHDDLPMMYQALDFSLVYLPSTGTYQLHNGGTGWLTESPQLADVITEMVAEVML